MASKKKNTIAAQGTFVQQGDVLFHPCADLPEGLKPAMQKFAGKLTVAEGEHSGHHHSCVADAETDLLEAADGTLYLVVKGEEATFTHQEHKPVTVAPGTYKIGRVREQDHLQEVIRDVQD